MTVDRLRAYAESLPVKEQQAALSDPAVRIAWASFPAKKHSLAVRARELHAAEIDTADPSGVRVLEQQAGDDQAYWPIPRVVARQALRRDGKAAAASGPAGVIMADDDVTFVKMIFDPRADPLAVTATQLFPPSDPGAVIEVHPSVVEHYRAMGWIIPRPHPLRRSTDR